MGIENVSVGLYISPRRVYLAEIERHHRQFRVTRSAEVEYTNAAVDLSQDIHNVLLLALQAAFEKSGITHKTLELTLSGNEATTRYFEMPLIPKTEWQVAVGFEAQKYVSFEIKDLRYVFEVIPDRAQKKMGVVFLAVKKQSAEKLLAVISESAPGMKVASLEPLSLSLVRAYAQIAKNQAKEVHCLAHIHEDGAVHFAIAKDQLLLLTRDCSIAPSPELPGELDYDTFVTETRLSFNYFNKNFKGQEIKRIVLFADTETAAKGWVERLRAEFGVVVETGMVPGHFSETKPLTPEMTLAIGASLRAFDPEGRKKLNLMRVKNEEAKPAVEPSPEIQKKNLMKRAFQTAVLSFVLVAVAHAALLFSINASSKRSEATKGSLAQLIGLSPEAATPLMLQQKELFLREKTGFFSSLLDQRIYLTEKLNELTTTLPETIALNSLTYTDQINKNGTSTISLSFDGAVTAGLSEALSFPHRYAGQLKQNARFMQGLQDVRINGVSRTSGTTTPAVNFSMDCLSSQSQKEQSYAAVGEMAQLIPR